MVSVFGLFGTYRDAEQAIDRLVVGGIDEEAINVIANAPAALERVGPELDSAERGKSGGDIDGMSETLDALLSSSPQVGVPETGMVVAGGRGARELVEHNTGIDQADTSLHERLMAMGLSEDEVRRYLRGIRNRGVMVWIEVEAGRSREVGALLGAEGARQVISRGR